MRSQTLLDYAIFQLTPTRTRCELYVVARDETEKLASGLLQPFLSHLQTAEDQLATGGYSITLEPVDCHETSWFTKGTVDRFVRFVSTPEVLERVTTIEMELKQLEETVRMQTCASSHVDDTGSMLSPSASSLGMKSMVSASLEKPMLFIKTKHDSIYSNETGVGETSKKQLLKALDARHMVLQKEQGMAFARAAAAGFDMVHLTELLVFSGHFGATRLREACIKFMALFKERQEAGLWVDSESLTPGHSRCSNSSITHTIKPRESPQTKSGRNGGDKKMEEGCGDLNGNSETTFYGEEGTDTHDEHFRHGTRRSQMLSGQRRIALADCDLEQSSETGSTLDMSTKFCLQLRSNPVFGRQQSMLQEQQFRTISREEGCMGTDGPLAPQHMVFPPAQPDMLSTPPAPYGLMDDYLENGSYRGLEQPRLIDAVRGYPPLLGWQGQPQFYQRSLHPHYLQSVSEGSAISSQLHTSQNQLNSNFLQVAPCTPSNSGSLSHSEVVNGPNWMGNPKLLNRSENYTSRDSPSPSYQGHRHGVSPNRQEGKVAFDQMSLSTADGAGRSPADDNDDNHSISRTRHSRRSSSPRRRRSPSPLRRLQIGRGGVKHSGMVVIRNINYMAPSCRRKYQKANGSAEKWSEKTGSSSGDEETLLESEAETLQASVQDIVGLFETKCQQDQGDVGTECSDEEHCLSSEKLKESRKNVSKRWIDTRVPIASTLGKSFNGNKELSMWEAEEAEAVHVQEMGLLVGRGRRAGSKNLANDVALTEARISPQRKHTGQQDALAVNVANGVGHYPNSRSLSSHDSAQLVKNEMLDDDLVTCEGNMMNGQRTVPFTSYKQTQQHENQEIPITSASSILYEQKRWRSLGTKFRDQLKLHGPEIRDSSPGYSLDPKQQLQQGVRCSDDSFVVPLNSFIGERVNMGRKETSSMESEMQGNERLAVIPKDGMKTNLMAQREPDDLFMVLSGKIDRAGISSNNVTDFDKQLAAETHSSDHVPNLNVTVPSKERVKRFLDQYNEKREAKRRDESSQKKVEREEKMKAMHELLEKRKAEMGRNRRSEKYSLLAEAQLRAGKLRAYKAALQKSKMEKEEEEKRRLEELKIRRQERIAARSNPGSSATPSALSTPQGIRSKSSTSRPTLVSKLPARLQKAAAPALHESLSGPSSKHKSANAKDLNANRLPTNSFRSPTIVVKTSRNPLSNSAPSVTEFRREVRKSTVMRASTGSQPIIQNKDVDRHEITNPPRGKSVKTGTGIIKGKNNQVSHASVMRKNIPASDSKVQGLANGKSVKEWPSTVMQHRISKSTAEVKQDAKNFLKKGDGAGSGSRTGFLKVKPESTGKVVMQHTKDKRVVASLVKNQFDKVENLRLGKKVKALEPESSNAGETEKRAERGLQLCSGGSEIVASSSTCTQEPSYASVANHAFSAEGAKCSRETQGSASLSVSDVQIPLCANAESGSLDLGMSNSDAMDFNSTAVSNKKCVVPSGFMPSATAAAEEEKHAPMVQMASGLDSEGALSQSNVCKEPSRTESPVHKNGGSCTQNFQVFKSPVCLVNEASSASPFQNVCTTIQSVSVVSDSSRGGPETHVKWGTSGNLSPPRSPIPAKEQAKGLKRFLQFGRRNIHSSGRSPSLPSTTREGDMVYYHGRKRHSNGKSSALRASYNDIKCCSGPSIDSDGCNQPGSAGTVMTLKSSRSAREAQSRCQDQELSDGSAFKAARSFFSLASFRNKAEGKPH